MTVFRRTPLPSGPARGKLVVTRDAIEATTLALRGHVGQDGRHEGVVFWLGRIVPPNTYVLSVLVPQSEHGPGSVRVAPKAVGDSARAARALGLAFVCQVHSHPGTDTRHSEGDDRMVPLPSEGMFSVVVADYGDGGVTPDEGAGVHQFQDGRWVQIRPAESAMVIVPALLIL